MGFFGFGDNKGSNCTEDESTGKIQCDVMTKHKNNLLATGSHFALLHDNNCNFAIDPTSRILDEDEAEVQKEIRRRKRTCMGGGAIN